MQLGGKGTEESKKAKKVCLVRVSVGVRFEAFLAFSRKLLLNREAHGTCSSQKQLNEKLTRKRQASVGSIA